MRSCWLCVIVGVAECIELRVATLTGSRYLDKRVDVEIEGTVGDLKSLLAEKFPGNPPASLQRLFYGSQLLDDDESLEVLDAHSLVLDMVPPSTTSSLARVPDDTTERVRAYVAETVALEHTWQMLRRGKDESEEMLCERIGEELAEMERALLEETLSESISAREARVSSGALLTGLDSVPPLAKWKERLAIVMNVHWKETGKVVLALMAAAKFGANDAFRKTLFVALVPAVLFAQTRQARFIAKIAWYALPNVPENSFFSAFFGAPQQVMLSLNPREYLKLLYLPAKTSWLYPSTSDRIPNAFKTQFFRIISPSTASASTASEEEDEEDDREKEEEEEDEDQEDVYDDDDDEL